MHAQYTLPGLFEIKSQTWCRVLAAFGFETKLLFGRHANATFYTIWITLISEMRTTFVFLKLFITFQLTNLFMLNET